MFTLKLVARPDARMVEVPLEIEAELPREFEGSAVLASSGLPRKVKVKAQKDALRLSTAYRIDQLAGDVVKSSFRGNAQDVALVQEAVVKFIRGVRERRQDGVALLISSNGRGKIDAVEQLPQAGPAAPPEPGAPAPSAELAALETRIAGLESGLSGRVAQLEARVAAMQKQIARTVAMSEVAGPGMEKMIARPAAAPPRRATALDAYADALRDELRARATTALVRMRAEVERSDKAATQAAEAEVEGGPRDGTAERLREASLDAAGRQTALQRLAEEIDLYPSGDLFLALQLVHKLEQPGRGAETPAGAGPAKSSAPPPAKAAGPFGSVADDERIRPEEAAAAATSSSRIPKIVAHDPSGTDEALAAEMALAVESEVTAEWQHLPTRPSAFDEPQGPDEVVGGGERGKHE